MNLTKTTTASIAFTVLVAVASVANAQGDGSPAAADAVAQQGGAASVDDATLDKFVVAYTSVQQIQVQASQQLQSVEDREKAQALQMAAQEQMIAAVRESGLSVEKYNEVVMRMNEDPALRQQVLEAAQAR